MRVLSVESDKLYFFAVRVIVYCLKSIGLAPFSVQIGKPAQINPDDSTIQAFFFFSKVGLAYNVLFLIPVTIVLAIYAPTFVYKHSLHDITIANILSAILTAERFLFIFTSCLIINSWAFRQKNAASIMNRLLEVDLRLSGLKKQPFNKRALIFLSLHIILNLCLWITIWVMIIDYFKFSSLPTQFFGRLPEYVIYWFIMEYVTIVGLVSRDLETVNKYLLDFEQFVNNLSLLPVRNVIPVEGVSIHCRSQTASLKLLRRVRTTLCEVCEDISDFFSLPILFSIACCFIPIFEKLYHMTQVTNDLPRRAIISLILMCVLKYIYPVVSLALNVTQTRREAESTGQIVHKLLAVAKTKEIKEELEQFSLQLLHEKVNFTAYGLFSLDSTLLQSMMGGVASYAIILTQFGSTICNCNCNFNNTSAE